MFGGHQKIEVRGFKTSSNNTFEGARSNNTQPDRSFNRSGASSIVIANLAAIGIYSPPG
jgi:hypothetical protein